MRAIILGGLLALLSSLVFADGATLVTAGPPVTAAVRQQWLQDRSVVSVQGITLNRNSFGANIVTVVIDGKTHTYIGQMQPFSQKSLVNEWSGKEGDFAKGGSYISLTRAKDTGEVRGTLWSQTMRYEITPLTSGGAILVQRDHSKSAGMQATPETPESKALDSLANSIGAKKK